jgi:mRNA interferase MazF
MPTFDARPGTVVSVPFPHTGTETRQRRPALVLARTGPEEEPFLLWALMITSAAHRPWRGDVPISDPEAVGLRIPSVIRAAKIATIEIARAEPLGTIDPETLSSVRAEIRRCLAV